MILMANIAVSISLSALRIGIPAVVNEMAIYLCEGKITKSVTMYVEADSVEEANQKIRNGDLENEIEGECEDCDMDYNSIRIANPDELPRKRK